MTNEQMCRLIYDSFLIEYDYDHENRIEFLIEIISKVKGRNEFQKELLEANENFELAKNSQ